MFIDVGILAVLIEDKNGVISHLRTFLTGKDMIPLSKWRRKAKLAVHEFNEVKMDLAKRYGDEKTGISPSHKNWQAFMDELNPLGEANIELDDFPFSEEEVIKKIESGHIDINDYQYEILEKYIWNTKKKEVKEIELPKIVSLDDTKKSL